MLYNRNKIGRRTIENYEILLLIESDKSLKGICESGMKLFNGGGSLQITLTVPLVCLLTTVSITIFQSPQTTDFLISESQHIFTFLEHSNSDPYNAYIHNT